MSKLWRYFDLIKFLTLVNGELYFARADKFKDKYEGAIPKQNYLHFTGLYSSAKQKMTDEKALSQEFQEKFNERKKKAAISCWHLNETESAAMWEVYSRAGQGIAVCTTLEKLKKIQKPGGYEMEMFAVDYVDFAKANDTNYIDYELFPFKNKRKEFEYEHEFRIMLYQKNQDFLLSKDGCCPKNGLQHTKRPKLMSELNNLPEEGIKLSIGTAELIDEIIASPDMADYEVSEIQKILEMINKLKGTGFTLRKSRLYENLHY